MAKYTWPTPGRYSDGITAMRMRNEAKARISGLESYATADTRDAALAELLAGTSEVYNVKAYGATGDGSTVDTVAVQSALDAAEADTDAVGNVYMPPGKYLLGTIYIPLGVTLFGAGDIETTGRAATTLIQSGTGDVIRFKSLLSATLYRWYGTIRDLAIFGDSSESTGFGINFKDVDDNLVNIQDTVTIKNLSIRKMPEGGINIPTGVFPFTVSDCKFLFNNGPGITVTRTTVVQGLHFLNISGDGNNGGVIALNTLNTGYGNVVITNLKSEFRVNADYSSAEHQSVAIVCTNCGDLPITINGATHISSVPDGGNFKKPGDFISISGTEPSIHWTGVAIRVRGSDTGTDPLIIGGSGEVSPPDYTTQHGLFNNRFRMLGSVLQYQRKGNTDVTDTTPSVAGCNVLLLTSATTRSAITDFHDGVDGQLLIVTFADGNSTLSDNANLLLAGAITGSANDTITLLNVAGPWREISRSVN